MPECNACGAAVSPPEVRPDASRGCRLLSALDVLHGVSDTTTEMRFSFTSLVVVLARPPLVVREPYAECA